MLWPLALTTVFLPLAVRRYRSCETEVMALRPPAGATFFDLDKTLIEGGLSEDRS